MKKLLMSLVAVFALSSSVFAQHYYTEEETLQKDVRQSDLHVSNPKRINRGDYWLNRGWAYYRKAMYATKFVYNPMPVSELQEGLSKAKIPFGSQPFQHNDKEYTLYSTKDFDAYVLSDTVRMFLRKNDSVFIEFDKAFEAFNKSLQPLEKPLKAKDADIAVKNSNDILEILKEDAGYRYNLKMYSDAAQKFIKVYEMGKKKTKDPVIDTSYIFYAGMAYCLDSNYTAALAPLEEALKQGYHDGGNVYYYLAFCKLQNGDKAGVEEVLVEGIKKYPGNRNLLENLIQHYVSNREDPKKVIPYIKQAQENNPNNVLMYVFEGIAYDELKDRASAETAYLKAIEKDPKVFEAYFNLAITYAAVANEMIDDLNKMSISDQKTYDKKNQEIKDQFKKALAMTEKADELKPNDQNIMTMLRQFYFRFRDESPEMMAKYNKYNELTRGEE